MGRHMAATGDNWGGGAGKVCELGLRSRPPYLSGELPSGAKGSPSGRCSPSGPGPGAGTLLVLPLPRSMPVGGAAVRALVLKRSRAAAGSCACVSARRGDRWAGLTGSPANGRGIGGWGQRLPTALLPRAAGSLALRPLAWWCGPPVPQPGLRAAVRSPAVWL